MAGNFIERSRHGTVFYFRRRVPLDLIERIGKGHIYVTLQTHERRTALIRARALAVQTDELFDAMRKSPLDPLDPRSEFVDSQGRITDHSGFFKASQRLKGSPPRKYGKRMALKLHESGRPSELVFDEVKPGEEEAVAKLAREFMPSEAKTSATARTTPTIREAIDEVAKSNEIGPRTLKEYLRVFDGVAGYFGADTRLGDITQEQFAEYAAHIRANPSWSAKTKATIITTAGRLFNRYEGSNSAVPTMKTKGLKPRRTRPPGEDRDAFTLEELREVFKNALKYRDNNPSKWWCSVAPAFLGCRIEELAQAHLAGDFYRDSKTGAMVLRVTEDMTDEVQSSKSVKTFAGWRRVPVHPVLEEMGFFRFLEEQREAGHLTPFAAEWKPYNDKRTGGTIHSQYLVKWGARELQKLRKAGKIPADGKLTYFHSMRHSFITQLAGAGVGEEWRAGLAGQQYGGVNSEVYSKARHDVSLTLPIVRDSLEPLARVLREVMNGEVR